MLEHRCLLSITPSTVVGRFTFYDNSHYDGGIAGVNSSDDSAIASDKSALLSGSGQATFANMTSYDRGINGILIDISGSHPGITAGDFTFKVGNNNTPGSWAAGPAATTVTVRAGAGAVSGSDRVEILWADNAAIRQQWLEVIVAADGNTGLATSDEFFFGNEIGNTGSSNTTSKAITTNLDVSDAVNHGATIKSNIPDTNLYDFSRDGNVNSTDVSDAVNHGTTTKTGLNFIIPPSISPPALGAGLANDTGTSNSDGITFDPTTAGTLTAANGITSFKAGLNNGPVSTDALPLVQVGGAFTLSSSFLATVNGGSLPDGAYVLHLRAVDSQGLSAARDVPFTLSTALPAISASTMASFTDDLTPHVTVTASDPLGLANGTQVSLDVDLNNNGNFTDPGELGRTQTTLYAGSAYFQMNPALPSLGPDGPYTVQLRVRVTDIAGNQGFSPLQSLKIDTNGNTILQDYVNAPDATYSYSLASTIVGSGYTDYIYDMHSQTWRSTADVNNPLWKHWLQVIVPTGTLNSTALLLIDGGSNSTTPPTSVNGVLVADAIAFHSVVIDLPTVPNEPLIFTGDPGHQRSEDAIIAYTFNQYTTHLDSNGDPLPGYETWPALLPMVKSAVRAMDTVQAVVPGLVGGAHVDNFVVTGYSKRGWTTWLTAAVDSRVVGIVPGVFDVLNLDEEMIHHHAFYGGIPAGPTFVDGFSVAIQDYVGYGVPENVETLGGQALGRVVDPYRYLNNGHFNIPKLELNSSGDEFFIPDSAQFYFSDLPGTKNYLRYIPNTGHGLNGTDPVNSTASFYNAVLNNLALPQFSWAVQADGSIRVQTVTAPTNVVMWQATAPTYRDFRHGYNSNGSAPVYTSSTLVDQGGGVYVASVPTPSTGATAFFVQLTFTSPLTGNPYIFTTEIKIATDIPLPAWPFFTATNAALPAMAASSSGLAAIPSSLAGPVMLGEASSAPQPLMATAQAFETLNLTRLSDDDVDSVVDDWPWLEDHGPGEHDADSSNDKATDLVLGSLAGNDLL